MEELISILAKALIIHLPEVQHCPSDPNFGLRFEARRPMEYV